jgi:opacity protein-like surface antigen
MKKLLLLALLFCSFATAHAQDDVPKAAFSIGPELVIPSRSIFTIGYGASAKVEVPVYNRLDVTFTGGYSSLKYKSGIADITGIAQPNATFIPLKAGLRYMGGSAYLEAEGGDVIQTSNNTGNAQHNLFTFSIGPGFFFHISEKQAIDLGFRYEVWSQNTLQQTGIRLAYRLGW